MKKAIIAIIIATLMLTGCSARYTTDGQSSQASSINVTEQSSKADSEGQSDIAADASGAISSTAETALGNLPNEKICWGQGIIMNDKNQPVTCAPANEKYGKYGGVFIDSDQSNIRLTFDEGYENGYTSPILDTLKEKNVKAVFFVTYDYCKRNPDLVKRMIDEGHTVGNHSWGHYSMPTLTVEKMESEITKLHDYVQNNFSYSMTLFRPPMGEFSERSLAVAQSLGYETLLWSFAYYDYDVNKQPSRDKALAKIKGAAHGGGIFLLHAISSANAEVLGEVIDSFRAEGYTLNPTL